MRVLVALAAVLATMTGWSGAEAARPRDFLLRRRRPLRGRVERRMLRREWPTSMGSHDRRGLLPAVLLPIMAGYRKCRMCPNGHAR